jgi:hypothetical protein
VVPRDLCGLGILIRASYSEHSKNYDFVELTGIMKHLAKTVVQRHTIIIIVKRLQLHLLHVTHFAVIPDFSSFCLVICSSFYRLPSLTLLLIIIQNFPFS